MTQNSSKSNNETGLLRAMRNKRAIGSNMVGEENNKKMHSVKLSTTDKRQNKTDVPVSSSIKTIKSCSVLSKTSIASSNSNQRYIYNLDI